MSVRPVLAASVFVRTYVSDRGRQWVLVPRSGEARLAVDAATRAVLELSDGNRTLEAIARELGTLEVRDVERLLASLFAGGLVVDAGAAADAPASTDAVARTAWGLERVELDRERPLSLVVAPGVGVDCDGRGGCCRLYDRVGLDADDAERIAASFGDERTPGGLYVASALVQERADEAGLGLAVIDGRCALLDADGWCGVHTRAGALAKPASCRFYPLRDVLCGDELHVGLAVECRCVIDFADAPPAKLEALAEELRARRQSSGVVEAVAAEVPISDGRRVPCAEYVQWRAQAGARLERIDGDGSRGDVLAWALAEAAALEGAPVSLSPFVEPLGAWLAREAADTGALYAPDDLQHQLFAWGAAAAARLRASDAASLAPVDGELLLARQLLHIHGLLRAPTLAAGLRSLALRIGLARAGAREPIPRALLPLSAAEYLARTHSFGHLFG